jgi:pimeloyl-ACP methyl ester carboxylesterase
MPQIASTAVIASVMLAGSPGSPVQAAGAPPPPGAASPIRVMPIHYRTIDIDGVDIFYREAGPKDAPVVLLLHGFPSSSHMYRQLIPLLADRYRVIAPDYPGFGQSGMPPPDRFDYSFDRLAAVMDKFTEAVGARRYAMYVQDYGAPVGLRMAAAHPQRVTALVIQNGNAYQDGIDNPFWDGLKAYWSERSNERAERVRQILQPDATKWFYTDGARDPAAISPDTWTIDQAGLDRPGNKDIQLALLYDYRNNPPRYAAWQAYFRKHQPPTLIVWGKNDKGFPPIAAQAYLRDLPKAELHMFDTGHFALEENSAEIGMLMRAFLARAVGRRHGDRLSPTRPRHTREYPT